MLLAAGSCKGKSNDLTLVKQAGRDYAWKQDSGFSSAIPSHPPTESNWVGWNTHTHTLPPSATGCFLQGAFTASAQPQCKVHKGKQSHQTYTAHSLLSLLLKHTQLIFLLGPDPGTWSRTNSSLRQNSKAAPTNGWLFQNYIFLSQLEHRQMQSSNDIFGEGGVGLFSTYTATTAHYTAQFPWVSSHVTRKLCRGKDLPWAHPCREKNGGNDSH